MALKFNQPTDWGIDVTYHRIAVVTYNYDEGTGEIIMFSYIDASKRASKKRAGAYKIPLAKGVIRDPQTELSLAFLYGTLKNIVPEMASAEDV